jgi:hypothetical protein
MLDQVPDLNTADEGQMRRISADRKSLGAEEKAFSHARLGKLIEEATVDCYTESEQVSGLFCALEERLEMPFTISILGVEAVVERIELTEGKKLLPCAAAGVTGKGYPFWNCHCRIPGRPAPSGWKPIAAGRVGSRG